MEELSGISTDLQQAIVGNSCRDQEKESQCLDAQTMVLMDFSSAAKMFSEEIENMSYCLEHNMTQCC